MLRMLMSFKKIKKNNQFDHNRLDWVDLLWIYYLLRIYYLLQSLQCKLSNEVSCVLRGV